VKNKVPDARRNFLKFSSENPARQEKEYPNKIETGENQFSHSFPLFASGVYLPEGRHFVCNLYFVICNLPQGLLSFRSFVNYGFLQLFFDSKISPVPPKKNQ